METQTYAIVRAGGKQYRVSEGTTVDIDRLPQEVGEKVTLDQVLLVSKDGNVTVGTPTVEGASVNAVVVNNMRAKKIIVFKKKRRQGYKRKQGHRQELTRVRVESLVCP